MQSVMNKTSATLSFIIPARNEEGHIADVIGAIRRSVEGRIDHEIIVVDNGSQDATVLRAETAGARVFVVPSVTIAALRNCGVSHSRGEILIFIDADVYLDPSWGIRMAGVAGQILDNPFILTGSIYDVSDPNNWIERFWFSPVLSRTSPNYINGGHLIVSRRLFDIIGGFKENLETSEDCDFCQRAKLAGARIVNNTDLRVVHQGYPRDVGHFFRRERWHGRGEYASWTVFRKSKAAVLSLFQAVMFLISFAAAIYFQSYSALLLFSVWFGAVCTAAALYRYRHISCGLIYATFLYGVYFVARTVAFIDVVSQRPARRRRELPGLA
jgi:glycosyltransferase involved in cell wall biosynthesis